MRIAYGISDRDRAALRKSKNRKALEPHGVNHGLQVVHPSVDRQLAAVPIRKSVTSSIITDQGMMLGQARKCVPIERKLPIKLQMVDPVGRF